MHNRTFHPFLRLAVLAAFLFVHTAWSQAPAAEHPRALISAGEVPELREKIKQEPFKNWVQYFEKDTRAREKEIGKNDEDAVQTGYLAFHQAGMYLFTGKQSWADAAWQTLVKVLEDPHITNDPVSRGLNRATVLKLMALTYDLAFNGWSEQQCRRANNKIYEVMLNTSSNMGLEANYSLASNWMGIRYASVLLASKVYDDFEATSHRTRAKPFEWDATNRLLEHLEANFYENGWNGESLGYFAYNWSFVGPALITLFNNSSIDFSYLPPKLTNAMRGYCTAFLPIEGNGSTGVKIDLSDDGPGGNPLHMLAYAFKVFPAEQQPFLKWVHDRFSDPGQNINGRGYLLYSILYYPAKVPATNPEQAGWRTYHDPGQGMALFRNRFKNEKDILFAYTSTDTRVKGHSGPDTNTFRLVGLGLPWIIGGGRTWEIAGQTNLFPPLEATAKKGEKIQGEMLAHHFNGNGSGYALGRGSSVGVADHLRFVAANYSAENEAAGAFVVADRSSNGQRWRLVVPEFVQVSTTDSSFTLTGPDGQTLRGLVFHQERPLKITTGTLRYGGSTVRHNTGIGFRGKAWRNSHFLDVYCDGEISVVMTLQPASAPHPEVRYTPKAATFQIGQAIVPLRLPQASK